MIEEELNYEILEQHFKEQDRLIAEGKTQKPQIIYGFTPEDRKAFDNAKTMDEILNNLEKKNIY